MTQLSNATNYILTDAMWAKAEPNFAGSMYKPRNTRQILDTILRLADVNQGWDSLVVGMSSKTTTQKYIHIWLNNGILSKILATLNRGNARKISIENVRALLAVSRKPRAKAVTEKPVAVKLTRVKTVDQMAKETAISVIEDAIVRRAVSAFEGTMFTINRLYDAAKTERPTIHYSVVKEYTDRRLADKTLVGNVKGLLHEVVFDKEGPAPVFVDATLGKRKVTVEVVKEDPLEHSWEAFLGVYKSTHWTKKKKMAQKVNNWSLAQLVTK